MGRRTLRPSIRIPQSAQLRASEHSVSLHHFFFAKPDQTSRGRPSRWLSATSWLRTPLRFGFVRGLPTPDLGSPARLLLTGFAHPLREDASQSIPALERRGPCLLARKGCLRLLACPLCRKRNSREGWLSEMSKLLDRFDTGGRAESMGSRRAPSLGVPEQASHHSDPHDACLVRHTVRYLVAWEARRWGRGGKLDGPSKPSSLLCRA